MGSLFWASVILLGSVLWPPICRWYIVGIKGLYQRPAGKFWIKGVSYCGPDHTTARYVDCPHFPNSNLGQLRYEVEAIFRCPKQWLICSLFLGLRAVFYGHFGDPGWYKVAFEGYAEAIFRWVVWAPIIRLSQAP